MCRFFFASPNLLFEMFQEDFKNDSYDDDDDDFFSLSSRHSQPNMEMWSIGCRFFRLNFSIVFFWVVVVFSVKILIILKMIHKPVVYDSFHVVCIFIQFLKTFCFLRRIIQCTVQNKFCRHLTFDGLELPKFIVEPGQLCLSLNSRQNHVKLSLFLSFSLSSVDLSSFVFRL